MKGWLSKVVAAYIRGVTADKGGRIGGQLFPFSNGLADFILNVDTFT